MENQDTLKTKYVICVKNDGYPASLELLKIYKVLPDLKAAKYNYIRVIDESGEDYLYPEDFFTFIEIPQSVESVFSTMT